MALRFSIREDGLCLISGGDRVWQRSILGRGLQEMPGQLGTVTRPRLLRKTLQSFGRRKVQPSFPPSRDFGVEHLLGERMIERVRVGSGFPDQARRTCFFQSGFELLLTPIAQLAQPIEAEGLAEHAGILQDLLCAFAQASKPLPDHRADAFGYLDLRQAALRPVAFCLVYVSALHQEAQQVLNKEWIAFGALVD